MTTATVDETKAAADAAAAKAASDQAASDAAKAATEKAAADKAASDKAAADAAAAAAANAGKTPEQLAAEKTAADAETARKAAEQAKAPDKYVLTLPETTTLTADMLPLIEAEAKAMGLTQDQAQNLVKARSDTVAAMSATYLTDAKADPEIGGAKWDATVANALKGVDYLFPKDSPEGQIVRDWFNATGLGNHKVFLRAMARIGVAQREDTPAIRTNHNTTERLDAKDVLFPKSKADSGARS